MGEIINSVKLLFLLLALVFVWQLFGASFLSIVGFPLYGPLSARSASFTCPSEYQDCRLYRSSACNWEGTKCASQCDSLEPSTLAASCVSDALCQYSSSSYCYRFQGTGTPKAAPPISLSDLAELVNNMIDSIWDFVRQLFGWETGGTTTTTTIPVTTTSIGTTTSTLDLGWLYQELANSYSASSGWSSSYPASNAYDSDWSSYGYASGTSAYVYINYTKPLSALSNSLWQVKDGAGTANLTIPSSCWNFDSAKLSFRVYSSSSNIAEWFCNDGGWASLRRKTSTKNIFSEGMYWFIG